MDENRESQDNLRENLSSWGMTLEELPMVFQYNKRDLPDLSEPSELARLLDVGSRPAFEGVAVQGRGVLDTLRAIGFMVMKRLAGMEVR